MSSDPRRVIPPSVVLLEGLKSKEKCAWEGELRGNIEREALRRRNVLLVDRLMMKVGLWWLKKLTLEQGETSHITRNKSKQNCPGRKCCTSTGPLTWQIPLKSQSFVWISCYLSSEDKCSVHLCGLPTFPFYLREFHIYFKFWGGKRAAWLMSQWLCQAGSKSRTLTPKLILPALDKNCVTEIKLFTTQSSR